jgi:hypothetical protein
MVSTDFGIRLNHLSDRITLIEDCLKKINFSNSERDDWDDATLQREWGICKRTAANYRKNGLKYFKRDGRIYYTQQNREEFLNKRNRLNENQ